MTVIAGSRTTHRRATRAAGALAAIACTLLLGACGASSLSVSAASGGVSPAHVHAAIAFARCMRTHGVPNFPDPTGGGGIQIPNDVNPFSPAFKAAQTACAKLMPGGAPRAGSPSEQDKLQMLHVSECMRAHGLNNFPDPTFTPPVNITNYSIAIGRGGVFILVPKSINPTTALFQQAAQACNFR